MKKKIIIAITVRLASSRLKKKALLKFGNKTIIEWCIQNCKKTKLKNNKIFLATTDKKEDKFFKQIAKKNCISYYSGSNLNVIKRLYDLCLKNNAQYLIRVTGDSPFIYHKLIDYLINFINEKNEIDFAFFCNEPLGIKPELLSASSLKKILKYNQSKKCEYISLFYKNNPHLFKIKKIALNKKNLFQKLRLNIDYEKDLLLHKTISSFIKKKNYDYADIKKLYKSNKKIFKINQNIKPVYISGKIYKKIQQITKL